MHDRPTAGELLQAVRDHLERAVLPALGDPKLRFQTLVCAHVVGIVEREIALEESALRAEHEALAALLGKPNAVVGSITELRAETAAWTRELGRQIRAGDWDGADRARRAMEHVRRVVTVKLAVANPRYASVGANVGTKMGA